MRRNALYFPYINLPEKKWLYSLLLYWDRLSSIVPYEFIQRPERLSPFMRALVQSELVTQLIPGQYLYEIPNFGEPFLDYIEGEITRKPRRIRVKNTLSVHVEKLGSIADELEYMGVVPTRRDPWIEMEPWAANAFMSYLATTLGNLASVESAPVTDNYTCFSVLGGSSGKWHLKRVRSRQHILQEILPCPHGQLDLERLVKFKSKHGHLLSAFRDRIETMCIDLSAIPDPFQRRDREQIAIRQLKDEINVVRSAIKESWPKVIFTDLFPILGFGSAVVNASHHDDMFTLSIGAVSLATAVYRSFERQQDRRRLFLNHPLAYAAFAKKA